MKAQWILILTLLFALVTAVFAVINVEAVRVNFLFVQADIPLILVILGSVLLGGLIVGFIGLFRQLRMRRTIRQLEKQLQERGTASGYPEQVRVPVPPVDEALPAGASVPGQDPQENKGNV